jgi:hypothetical protein
LHERNKLIGENKTIQTQNAIYNTKAISIAQRNFDLLNAMPFCSYKKLEISLPDCAT